ncbi:MAG: hypothetical protein PHQ23_03270 [Candidatus Wallbacteria bacterium]|nr:hypothetical protein [Candidatus Wallbacteria bacterium]
MKPVRLLFVGLLLLTIVPAMAETDEIIVYLMTDSEINDPRICSFDPGTGNITVLKKTTGKSLLWVPSLSQDRAKFCYTFDEDGDQATPADESLSMMGIGATEEALIANFSFSVTAPSFFPDGNKVLFLGSCNNHSFLASCNLSGDEFLIHYANTKPKGSPVLSPDGKKILFTELQQEPQKNWSLCLMNLEGTDCVKLTDSVETACFSPDGKSVAFSRSSQSESDGIFLLDLQSGQIKSVIHCHDVTTGIGFSPDGQRIYFIGSLCLTHYEEEILDEIFSVSIDGTDLKRLTTDGKPKMFLSVH